MSDASDELRGFVVAFSGTNAGVPHWMCSVVEWWPGRSVVHIVTYVIQKSPTPPQIQMITTDPYFRLIGLTAYKKQLESGRSSPSCNVPGAHHCTNCRKKERKIHPLAWNRCGVA